MAYRPLFDPTGQTAFDPQRAYRLGDRAEERMGSIPYVYDDEIELAINVALAAGRPLLIGGPPGTGKSSLARSAAHKLGWRFYETTVSSRTTARDLAWTFDTVARLADAQAGPTHIREHDAYVTPGVLWWAFDPTRALKVARLSNHDAFNPSDRPDAERAVVLIDEIDKADPDVPNDLLLPLGSFRFELDEGRPVQATHPPLVMITTNGERDLPRAFLRRCVFLELKAPGPDRLKRILLSHFTNAPDALLRDRIDEFEEIATRLDAAGRSAERPSVAELIDAVAACLNLHDPANAAQSQQTARLLIDKSVGTEP